MNDFVAQMEALVGTDAACGVIFSEEIEEGTPRSWSAAEYDALPEPKPDTCSLLPNDWSACCCTGYAHLIRERLGADRVRVVGFANEDNPTSLVAREEWHPQGHDFALVDDRYIVDPWPRLVHFGDPARQMVFDLNDPRTLEIYGPRECWKALPVMKAGPELVVGDIIKFWTNGDAGMRVEKLMPYTGAYPEICCAFATLRGVAGKKEGMVTETAIEHKMMYEIIQEKS